MAKFDHHMNLPLLFQKNKLSILPVSRSKYVIGKFDTYQKVRYNDEYKQSISLPSVIESIDYTNIYSEAAALLCAYNAGVFDDLFGEEFRFTLNGRMSTGIFDFNIRNLVKPTPYSVNVQNAQCEIDAGFESLNYLLLVEAKNFTVDDFLIRQLYFPYRLWSGKVSKKVLPVFMTYSNDVFSFFVYDFENANDYNSLILREQRHYAISDDTITLAEIHDLHETTTALREPEIPFPQADSFERVVDLLGLLMDGDLNSEQITMNYQFERRQTNYYTDAARYLGLVEKRTEENQTVYSLSPKGREIMLKRHKHKVLALMECMFQHEVFSRSYSLMKRLGEVPSVHQIFDIMRQCTIWNVNSDSTRERRASTVRHWIGWITQQVNEEY